MLSVVPIFHYNKWQLQHLYSQRLKPYPTATMHIKAKSITSHLQDSNFVFFNSKRLYYDDYYHHWENNQSSCSATYSNQLNVIESFWNTGLQFTCNLTTKIEAPRVWQGVFLFHLSKKVHLQQHCLCRPRTRSRLRNGCQLRPTRFQWVLDVCENENVFVNLPCATFCVGHLEGEELVKGFINGTPHRAPPEGERDTSHLREVP